MSATTGYPSPTDIRSIFQSNYRVAGIRLYQFSGQIVLSFLQEGVRAVRPVDPIPPEGFVRAVHYDAERDVITVAVEHPSFTEIANPIFELAEVKP